MTEATSEPSTQNTGTATPGARRSMLRWARIIPVALGLVIGFNLGAAYGFLSGDPRTMEWFSPEFGVGITTVGLVLVLGVVGLVLLIPRVSRGLGISLVLIAGSIGAGFVPGVGLGPRWQVAQSFPGSVRVELAAPVSATFEARSVCTIRDNDRNVGSIEVEALGTVGIDRLRLSVQMFGNGTAPAKADSTFPQARLGVNGSWGYDGSVELDEVAPDRRTGRGTLSVETTEPRRIGGPTGPAAVTGTISWDCTAQPGATPLPTESLGVDQSLQGWFKLHGIVTVEQAQPGQEPPFPGQASGTCSPSLPLGTAKLETVVPWIGGMRARLSLAPTLSSATLTIEPDDGSAPETATAPATITQRYGDRFLHAEFDLDAGRLILDVDWFCPER